MRYAIRLIIYILLLAIALKSAGALGVSPASTIEHMEPGMDKYVNVRILNPDGQAYRVTAYAEGALAQHISFPIMSLEIGPKDDEKLFSYRIQLPKEMDRKGELKTNIVLLAIPEKQAGDTRISANTEIISTLKVIIPYDEIYAEAKLFIPQLAREVESKIIIEATNHGSKKILRGFAIIDIYDSVNEKVLFLKSEEFSLEPKKMKSIPLPWTPDLRTGTYHAKLTFVYDGMNAYDDKTFNLGQPEILIKDISVKDFSLGGIAKFDILLQSEWNRQIPDVYGVVSVTDKREVLTTFKTATIDMDAFGAQVLDAYWDTTAAKTGNYQIIIDLNYLGKTTSTEYDIQVHPKDISIGPTGKVINAGDKESAAMNVVTLLVLVILLLIIVIIAIVFKKK